MSEQNKVKEVSQNEEKNVSREMTAQEMEQVTGGARNPYNSTYIGNVGQMKTQIYTGR